MVIRSSRLFRVQHHLQLRNLVSQQQASLFQPTQREFVHRGLLARPVNQVVQVGMLHPQFDEQALGRMQVVLHGEGQVALKQGESACIQP